MTLLAEFNQASGFELYRLRAALDLAVALAYGWDDYTPDMPESEILKRLLALNLARSASAN